MLEGVGVDKVVVRRITEASVRREAEEFRLFRFCLRNYPSVPAARFERELKHRTRIAYNRERDLWELLLTSRPNVMEDVEWIE